MLMPAKPLALALCAITAVLPQAQSQSGLFEAARRGDAEYLRQNVTVDTANSTDEFGLSLLMWASAQDKAPEGAVNVEPVRVLLARGAKLEYVHGKSGWTAPRMAVRFKRSQILRALLQAGADVESPDWDRMSLLNIASASNDIESARTLLEFGADPNWHATFTCLELAVRRSNLTIVGLLLESGARIDVPNMHGETLVARVRRTLSGDNAIRKLVERAAARRLRERDWSYPLSPPLTRRFVVGKKDTVNALSPSAAATELARFVPSIGRFRVSTCYKVNRSPAGWQYYAELLPTGEKGPEEGLRLLTGAKTRMGSTGDIQWRRNGSYIAGYSRAYGMIEWQGLIGYDPGMKHYVLTLRRSMEGVWNDLRR